MTCVLAEPPLPWALARAPCSAVTFSALNSGAERLTPTNCASESRVAGGSDCYLNFAPSSDDCSFQVIGAPGPPLLPLPQQATASAQSDSHWLVHMQRYSASAFGFGH